MPFHCLSSSGEKLYSFTYDHAAWAKLKEQSKSLGLKMSCCDTPAVVKTSRLGTQFFAHKSKSSSCEYRSKGETVEHQFCKFLVSRQLHQMGWHVETEKVGYSPEGKMWIADIYAERKKAKLAIEIQWSPQDYEETVRRQQVYKSSGLECVWFLRVAARDKSFAYGSGYSTRTREVPVFPFTKEHDNCFYVHETKTQGDLTERYHYDYSLELCDFVKELFSGFVQFYPKYHNENNHRIGLTMRFIKCYGCGWTLRLPLGVRHRMKEYEHWNRHFSHIEDLNYNEIDAVNTLFSQKYSFIPLKLYEHKLYGLSVYAQCTHCGKQIPLTQKLCDFHDKYYNTTIEATDIPWPEPYDYPKNEKKGDWFYSGNKPITKTWDMRRADDERRSEARKLKKEQSKLQTSEVPNDQPN